MLPSQPRYVVGIDLGTTNTVVAFAEIGARATTAVQVFRVAQHTSATHLEVQPLLPSALYAPMPGEVEGVSWLVGAWAKSRSTEAPERSVTSAKSWLAHAGVDRTADILPWRGSDEEPGPRISPVDAQATILRHIRDAWDTAHPEAPLVRQEVVLTVPASFDEAARSLTIEAVRRVGLLSAADAGGVRLLEEPQAAFLDWARRVGDEGLSEVAGLEPAAPATEHGATELSVGGEVLVCDVGGGTTDFSLVRVDRDLTPTRVAVGEHLLLGGDNIDLALAHLLEPRLLRGGEERLGAIRFAELVHACRLAKERVLSDPSTGAHAPAEVTVTLLGEGSRLLAGARSTSLTLQEISGVLDAFFPTVTPPEVQRPRAVGLGLRAFGLPFERDPAVTRHLGRFLSRHAPHLLERSTESKNKLFVLLNGGVFHARAIVERMEAAVAALTGRRPSLLPLGDPDLSVARGAVAHGLSRHGVGRYMRGGSARSYHVGLEAAGKISAVCVLPRGTEPGRVQVLDLPLSLVVGQSARFELFASPTVSGTVGEVVDELDALERLPPLVTAIGAHERTKSGEVPVRLEAEITEIGTLELACVERTSQASRHVLHFDLRAVVSADGVGAARPARSAASTASSRTRQAVERIQRVFGKASSDVDPREAKNLLRELEKLLGERSEWTPTLLRTLFDELGPLAANRRRTPDHERTFWLLAGFCLRPGFGDPRDGQRLSLLEPLLDQGLVHAKEPHGWRAFWIAWRRLAYGLSEPTQVALRDLLDPFLEPEGSRAPKRPKGIRAEPADEVLHLVSSLERVPPTRRAQLGGWVLERTWTSTDPRLYAALGRLGARVPMRASAHHVVSIRTAENWIAHLLRTDWKVVASSAKGGDPAIDAMAFACVQMARLTGDRGRDVSDVLREDVRRRVESSVTDPTLRAQWLSMLSQVVAADDNERRIVLGDDLPLGLRLA